MGTTRSAWRKAKGAIREWSAIMGDFRAEDRAEAALKTWNRMQARKKENMSNIARKASVLQPEDPPPSYQSVMRGRMDTSRCKKRA
jgi:hypothetical protein